MESPHDPLDSELHSLLDTEQQRDMERLQAEYQAEKVQTALWEAIDMLGIQTPIGRGSATHDADYAALVTNVYNFLELQPNTEEDADERQIHAQNLAGKIWDDDLSLLRHLSLHLSEQMFPRSLAPDPQNVKRILMAEIVAEGVHDDDQWHHLIDFLFDGRPLDMAKPEDIRLVTEKINDLMNMESMPAIQLCNSIMAALGIPKDLDKVDETADLNHLQALLDTTHHLTTMTLRMAGDANQPNRHEIIYETARQLELGSETIRQLLDITDRYVP